MRTTRAVRNALLATSLLVGSARASNVTEFPDNGSEQLARGGAWIARASDPLAAFYNPGGLAGQPTRLTLQANLTMAQTCFTRRIAPNDTTREPLLNPDGTFPKVCSSGDPQLPPTLQLGLTWSPTPKLGLSLLFLTPSGVAQQKWPETVMGQVAPQRYLLMNGEALLLTPTLAAGLEVLPGLRVGAGFVLGMAPSLRFSSAVMSLNGDNATPRDNDMKAELTGKDMFIPGGTLGALWSPSDWVDVAGWFKFQKSIEASGDIKLYRNHFQPANLNGRVTPGSSGFEITDTSKPRCGTMPGTDDMLSANCKPDQVKIEVPIPVELKLGVRFHQPRGRSKPSVRDPMSQDVWDAEVNLTFAHNSAFDALKIRLPAEMPGSPNGILPVNGIPGSPIPANADVPHGYRDVFGVRVGGDWNLLPDQLALRAGGFFESAARNSQVQNIDFMGGPRLGLALGATYRLRWFPGQQSAVEISAGLMHMFVFEQTYVGGEGVRALAGSACNGSMAVPGQNCSNGVQKYRSNWPVNLGTIAADLTAFNLGVSYKF